LGCGQVPSNSGTWSFADLIPSGVSSLIGSGYEYCFTSLSTVEGTHTKFPSFREEHI
jgi:hypothetical protein